MPESAAKNIAVQCEMHLATKARRSRRHSSPETSTRAFSTALRPSNSWKKTWTPGKDLQKFIAATVGIQPREQQRIVESLSDAVADVGPLVRQAMEQHPGFEDLGKRMLLTWAEGVRGLRDPRVYALGDWTAGDAFEGFFAPPKQKSEKTKIGRSPLQGMR